MGPENKRILVADDNEAVRIMLEDILNEAGYKVSTSQDGLETIEALQKGVFDVVILDLLMPHKSGFEILESFESDGHNGRLGLYQIWKAG